MSAPFRLTDMRRGPEWHTASEHGTLEAAKETRYALRQRSPQTSEDPMNELTEMTRAIRLAYGPEAARATFTVAHSDDYARAPYLDALRVYSAAGQELAPTYAFAREHAPHTAPDPQLPVGVYDGDEELIAPTGSEGEYRAALTANPEEAGEIGLILIAVHEYGPYDAINRWLCSGPGWVRSGTEVAAELREEDPALPTVVVRLAEDGSLSAVWANTAVQVLLLAPAPDGEEEGPAPAYLWGERPQVDPEQVARYARAAGLEGS